MINTFHPKYEVLSQDRVLTIDLLHTVRDLIEVCAKQSEDVAKDLYSIWLKNETTLQKMWGFDEDVKYIKWWNYPRCTCPKMDNDDAYPSGYYVTSGNCPIHGHEVTQ